MLRSRRSVWLVVASALTLSAAGCTDDSPQQDPPPGIFTTTLGEVPTTTTPAPPTTAPAPAGIGGY